VDPLNRRSAPVSVHQTMPHRSCARCSCRAAGTPRQDPRLRFPRTSGPVRRGTTP